jgi:hypothetical protein
MLYVVVNGSMYQKVDGKVREIPLPLTPETSRETEEVWRRYDEAGQPFMMYHDTLKTRLSK